MIHTYWLVTTEPLQDCSWLFAGEDCLCGACEPTQSNHCTSGLLSGGKEHYFISTFRRLVVIFHKLIWYFSSSELLVAQSYLLESIALMDHFLAFPPGVLVVNYGCIRDKHSIPGDGSRVNLLTGQNTFTSNSCWYESFGLREMDKLFYLAFSVMSIWSLHGCASYVIGH
jgi:hypothetical protein